MDNSVSVFIMDVSDSTKHQMANELSDYLQQLQEMIRSWSTDQTPIQVIHRAGDELVVVSKGFATAYMIAFYICRIWKYPNHPPYFGFSFGYTRESFDEINMETWIHPLMKHARYANDMLQDEQNRRQFRFALTPAELVLEKLFNTTLTLQQELINELTHMQSFVFSLYMILGQQNKISTYLNRSKSTISIHMKNGKIDVIMQSFYTFVDVLNTLDDTETSKNSSELERRIKQHINRNMQTYLPIERNLS